MTPLDVVDWRRTVFALYAAVRDEDDPAAAHRLWRNGRDQLFARHPATPLLPATREADATPGARRNSATPTPEQWQHLFAIRDRLSAEERSKAETLIALLGPDVRAQFLAELSALSVDDAVRALRTTMRRLAVTTRS